VVVGDEHHQRHAERRRRVVRAPERRHGVRPREDRGRRQRLLRHLADELHRPRGGRQISELATFVEGRGPGSSLAAKIRAAGASLERDGAGATCNQLQALQNEVDAQAGGSLTAAQAAELSTRIGWIRTALGC
jgi:hypothetical protein